MVIIDAVVLAGGRSSRLDGTPKAGLIALGKTLLEHTLAAASSSRFTVVVGDAELVAAAAPHASVTVVREVPPFAGPASAIATGIEKLASMSSEPSDFTLVLACDMPQAGLVVDALRTAVDREGDGVVAASSEGRTQQLAGLYSTRSLAAAVRRRRDAGDLTNLSVRALFAELAARPVPVPAGSTDDIDTWDDAARFGIPAQAQTKE